MEDIAPPPGPGLNGVENNDMQNQTLHNAPTGFPLQKTGGRHTFPHRLCRENNWSNAEALPAIGEYERSVYRAPVSPTPATPPPAVDQVWRLHLRDTRSYCDGLCQGVLGRPLHHAPTAGGLEPPAGLRPARFNVKKQTSCGGILPGVFPLLLIDAGVVPVLLIVAFVVIALIVKLASCGKPKKKHAAAGGDLGGNSYSGGDSDCGDSGGGDCGGGDGGCDGGGD